MEPDFIAQNGEGLIGHRARHWFEQQAAQAKAEGCTHGRFTRHPEKGWLLVEAWRVAPRKDGELFEGEPRWQEVLD